MRITMLKLSGVIFLSTFLLICLGLLHGCDSPSSPDEQDTSDVRQPAEGQDLEAFWNQFDWSELNSAEKALWGVLGWDEASWDGMAAEPASESKAWSELTEEERIAAEQLGYNGTYWDSV